MQDLFENSTFTVGVSFFLFIGLLAYFGVHKMLIKSLDDRADTIRAELAEAKRLREEAQELYASFERKQKDVMVQADEIVAHAKAEAEAAAVRGREDLKLSIERRLRAADEQIAMAEADAVREVKDKAVSVAVAAAAEILQARMGDDRAAGLIDSAIDDVATRLN